MHAAGAPSRRMRPRLHATGSRFRTPAAMAVVPAAGCVTPTGARRFISDAAAAFQNEPIARRVS